MLRKLVTVTAFVFLCAATTAAPANASGEDPFAMTGFAGKCVDVAGAQTADGTTVQLYGCNGTDAQRWIRPADGTLRALDKCLDVAGGGTADGTRVHLWSCNGTAAQQWTVTEEGALVNPRSGRCLDATGWSSADGTPLQIWACGTPPQTNQTWAPPAVGGNIVHPSGSCIEISGENNRVALLAVCNNTADQHFLLPGDGTLRASGLCMATGYRANQFVVPCDSAARDYARGSDDKLMTVSPWAVRCLAPWQPSEGYAVRGGADCSTAPVWAFPGW